MAFLIWITGLSGSGKTTIGNQVYKKLKQEIKNLVFLDGDSFREITGNISGHSRDERFAVAMQISRMCKFLVEQDINVVCSTISLFKDVHAYNRKNIKKYYEIFVECSMDELISRDQKGIYSKALRGEVKNVVGVDMQFDRPENCDLVINNNMKDQLEEKVNKVINLIKIKENRHNEN